MINFLNGINIDSRFIGSTACIWAIKNLTYNVLKQMHILNRHKDLIIMTIIRQYNHINKCSQQT